MKQRAVRACAAWFILPASVMTQGQSMQQMSDAIRDAIATLQPTFQLERSSIQGDIALQRWERGQQSLVIGVRRMESTAAATEKLAKTIRVLPIGGEQALTGYGDAAFLISRFGPTGAAVLYFRKGPHVVSVSGPSEGITLGAAQLTAGAIAP